MTTEEYAAWAQENRRRLEESGNVPITIEEVRQQFAASAKAQTITINSGMHQPKKNEGLKLE